MQNPCYGCPDRNPTCHGKCEEYKEWKALEEEKNDKIRKARYDYNAYWGSIGKPRRRRKKS